MKVKLFLFVLIVVFFASCHTIPKTVPYNTKKIQTGFGPEDIVLDTISSSDNPRLLISCNTRRDKDSVTNGIYWLDLKSDSVYKFERRNEPSNLVFHPHGFDLVMIDSVPRLYVISHDDENNRHPIIRYKVLTTSLVFETIYQSPLFISPNDIFALKDESFFITNDAGKRHSIFEQILKLKRSSVVYHPIIAEPYYIDKKLSYANGIYFDDPFLYVSTTRGNTIFKFYIKYRQATDEAKLTKVIGGDNISRYKDKYLIAAHLNAYAFLRHVSKSKNPSPSVIYQFDPITGEKKVLFSDDGNLISAASTAIRFGNYLYVSQVFDDFILKVTLE